MISSETVNTFLEEFGRTSKRDPSACLKLIANFCEEEPQFTAFTNILLGNEMFKDPVTAALLALTCYKKMAGQQREADELNRGLGGSTQEEGAG